MIEAEHLSVARGHRDRERALIEELARELEEAPELWLRFFFPQYLTHELAPHQWEFWHHVWGIDANRPAEPFLAIWPRGGAKSTSLELGVVMLAARSRRRYAVYVSSTQDLADRHVATVGALLESDRLAQAYPHVGGPSVSRFGNPKGWRRNRLSVASGFIVDSIGLDTAARGIKVEEQRPDLIVFDDLDDATDGPKVTQTKIDRLTRTILPLGSEDAAVLGAQNVVIPNGIFARLAGVAEQQADFLTTAHVSGPVPAVRDLQLEQLEPDERGRPRWRIVAGVATWDGQDLAQCQRDLDTFGRTSFLIERQHQAELRSGGIFRAWEWLANRYEPEPMEARDPQIRRIRMWDTAGTEDTGQNDPDWTVGVKLALHLPSGRYRIEDVQRWRAASGTTKSRARAIAQADVELHGSMGITFGIEQEPGWHGRDWAQEWVVEVFGGFTAQKIPAFDSKVMRAEPGAAGMENGLLTIVRAPWNSHFLAELEAFPNGDHDDQVDAFAHGFNWLRKFLAVDSGAASGALRGMTVRRR